MTPLTDANTTQIIWLDETVGVVNAGFAQELERDLWILLIGSYSLYEDNEFNFPVDTCKIFEKYKPMMDKLLGYSEPKAETPDAP